MRKISTEKRSLGFRDLADITFLNIKLDNDEKHKHNFYRRPTVEQPVNGRNFEESCKMQILPHVGRVLHTQTERGLKGWVVDFSRN